MAWATNKEPNADGPDSNATAETPGHVDTGTHGCVNVPLSAMWLLYQ